MMEPLEVYKRNYKAIQSVYASRLKVQILLSLLKGPTTLSQLRQITGSTSQALIPKIRNLERYSLIESKEHGYILTSTGIILVSKMQDFVVTMGELMQHQEFWTNHDIKGIPSSFLNQIGDLYSSEVQFDTPDNIFHIYSNFLKILRDAKYIWGISNVMSPELAEAFRERVISGVPVELIVNRKVIEFLQQEPFVSALPELLSKYHFKIWVTDEPLQIGLTVTDRYLSLGLNKREGGLYDSSADLSSHDPSAVNWAHRLFQFYKERSTLYSG